MYTIADICIWPWINGLHENYGDAVQVSHTAEHCTVLVPSHQQHTSA